MKKFTKTYNELITIPNLLLVWEEFLLGKKKRVDVAIFQSKLIDNIFCLYHDLKERKYRHGSYQSFNISDPKPRNIHKATVYDRLLHHLLYQETYQYFDQYFINDSYSCRLGKGTHRAIYRLSTFAKKASFNNRKTVWVFKGDIRKFFASIDHGILKSILARYIEDQDLLYLFGEVIDSFNTSGKFGVGLPLGNLTSQLLVNIYMNEFDQFVKRDLKIKYYIRYADDFVILGECREELISLRLRLEEFLSEHLKLFLHPEKTFLKTLASGVDFLGWVQFFEYKVLRTTTKRRMLKRIEQSNKSATLASYAAMLKHVHAYNLSKRLCLLDR
ncbi:MAG: reverse transcriptase/maturase family protein [Patescibacteria group bacterium]|jgi:retron-type reverse transcriptase|nr:reverse transcriptase/maturase family protein [Patescibacteria group bacterium]